MIDVCTAQWWSVCHDCRLRHPCWTEQQHLDFAGRHCGHRCSKLDRDWLHDEHRTALAANDTRKALVTGWGPLGALWARLLGRERIRPEVVDAVRRQIMSVLPGLAALVPTLSLEQLLQVASYAGNADVKQAVQALATLTITNLNSLASSATAGWQSDQIDNSSNLYLDDAIQGVIDYANTAPANSKCAYVYAAGGLETGKLSNPFSGTQGTLTLLDVTANQQAARQIGTWPYTTADEVVEGSPLLVSGGFGYLPVYFAFGLMNHTGAAIAASGNTMKHQGVYMTVI